MASGEEEPGYYMVRAMSQTDAEFDLFFNKGVVAVGWSEIDFTAFDVEDLIQAVDEAYYEPSEDYTPQVVGKKKNEVRRFRNIEKGDRIVVPYGSSVALARARGKRYYDPAVAKTLDLSRVFNDHSDCLLADLLGILRCACLDSIFSKNEASGKAQAVQ